jgi:hypothetical protein
MLIQYIHAALERARYEIIDDEEPYYGEVPELEGVWATLHVQRPSAVNLI